MQDSARGVPGASATKRHMARLIRDDVITEALRAASEAIGNEEPTAQATRIVTAIKRLRDPAPVRLTGIEERIDYLERVQREAHAVWNSKYTPDDIGPRFDAIAGVDTPLGRLKVITWRRPWRGTRHENRLAWASEYYLEDQPVTIAEIKAMGLALRPTTRNRKSGNRNAAKSRI